MTAGLNAARIARAARKRINGVSVVYRDGETSLTVTATIGATRRDQQQHDGTVTHRQFRDFLIDASEFTLDDELFEPSDDASIEETDGSTVYVYSIAAPGGDERAVRYSDRNRLTWRIHTVLYEERPA